MLLVTANCGGLATPAVEEEGSPLRSEYVMKRSGPLPYDDPNEKSSSATEAQEGIDFLGARITRDTDATVWRDQFRYILHCCRENGFVGADGSVSLKKGHALPSVDEKLGEEDGSSGEKNDAMAWRCRKYIGQMMWLTTRTRPDISACLGILASLMVRRPKQVKAHLVNLWRYLWTTMSRAMSRPLRSFFGARKSLGALLAREVDH